MLSLLAYANAQASEKKTGNNAALSREVSPPGKPQLSFLEILTKTKPTTSAQVIIQNKEEALPQNRGEQPAPKKKKILNITHDDRVTKWFDPFFVYPDQDADGIYHTLLPLAYDKYVVKYGKKSLVVSNIDGLAAKCSKKLPKHDPMFTVYGIVRFDDASVDYYEFHATLGINKICYHRGCSKLSEGYQDFIDCLHSDATFNTIPEEDLLKRCKLPIKPIKRSNYNCTIELYEPMAKEEQ